MTIEKRIDALCFLGENISRDNTALAAEVDKAFIANPWFTTENSWNALLSIKEQFLQKNILTNWVSRYQFKEGASKKVGLILAGNIPLVGFHDVLSVFLSGHICQIKYSDKDRIILPFLLDVLSTFDPAIEKRFEEKEQLQNFDAVIATGSNNSARYFNQYFSKYPHIIRKHRNAVAVLNGQETTEDLKNLSDDIFQYFGLGCRNVSKIYVPENYDFELLLETLHLRKDLNLHNKYKNNFDYNIALFLLNQESYTNNGSIIIKEDAQLSSRIACLNYEYYQDHEDLANKLKSLEDQIQCITSQFAINDLQTIPLGQAQRPKIDDYADGIDTMKFLSTL